MGQRLQLHDLLKEALGSDHVYFQPPATVEMQFPCIVYTRDREDSKFAGNNPYTLVAGYQVTVIDRNPDSEIPRKIAKLPSCRHSAYFTKDNLHHDIYKIYF